MNFDPPTNDEIDESKDRQISGLEQILGSMDVDTEDLIRLVTAIGALKKNKKGTKEQTKEQEENKVFLDKTFVLGRDDVYIYRDNRTKKKGWYIRIYEARYRKHWGKSLKTTNKILAMAEAERIYAERKGRMSIGVRPVSITAKELVKLYQQERRKELTDIPHQGITPASFDSLCIHIKYWEKYMEEVGHTNTYLEDIPTELGLTFGQWIKGLKKTTFLSKNGHNSGRNNYTINHTIAAVKKMYRSYAKQHKYITENEIPMFKYLKVDREQRPKRDLITKAEFTSICRWMQYKWCNEKGITKKEQLKRQVYALVFTISHFTGMRPKEQLGLRWEDITINEQDDKADKKINRLVHIRSDNSKTGRSRDIIAPIAPQVERIKKHYRDFGFEPCKQENFMFPKMTFSSINSNEPTTIVAWNHRLKDVIKGAEQDGYFDSRGRNITLYSARHHYITEALLRGVDMYDVALNAGTSITYIEQTYSHVTTLMRSKEITKGLGAHRVKKKDSLDNE